jgi:hypothetical protein
MLKIPIAQVVLVLIAVVLHAEIQHAYVVDKIGNTRKDCKK